MPDYYNIIKNPVCFEDIEKKLKDKKYQSPLDFRQVPQTKISPQFSLNSPKEYTISLPNFSANSLFHLLLFPLASSR